MKTLLTIPTVIVLLSLSSAQAAVPGQAPALSSAAPAPARPNIVILLVDDMGYADLGCYGGEIKTPNIDRLAAGGLKFSQMYNMGKCYPTRVALQTGLYPPRTNKDFVRTATLGEVLRPAGYRTLWVGKNHATFNPVTRGYDRFTGVIGGWENHFNPGTKAAPGQPAPAVKANPSRWSLDGKDVADFVPQDPGYYDTDAFTDQALKWLDEYKAEAKPFLLYLAYTAPHYPLQAWPEDIANYKGVYDSGYEVIRKARYDRQVKLGLVDPTAHPLPPLEVGAANPAWDKLSPEARRKEAQRMEIYAAMVDRVDQNIGRLIKTLEVQGKLNNTLILFMSDNGACAEPHEADFVDPKAPLGSVGSFEVYGKNWASVGSTPFRKWKTTSHEGGIATPLVVSWPAGIPAQAAWVREPAHVVDIMPTVMALAGADYPGESRQAKIPAIDGTSLLPLFKGEPLLRSSPLFFQFGKGSAIRQGQWKLVRLGSTWELYDMASDRSETRDLAGRHPEMVKKMDEAWRSWWAMCTGSAWSGKAPKEEKEE